METMILVVLACAVMLFGCIGQPSITSPAPNATVAKPPEIPPSQALLKSLKSAPTWSATYSMFGASLPSSYDFAQYVQNRQNFRTDVMLVSMQSRTYILGNKAYSCANLGQSWSCSQFPKEVLDASPAPSDLLYSLEAELEKTPSQYSVSLDGKMDVAKASADCYLLASAEAKVRYCVSAGGIPLYLSYNSTGAKPVEVILTAKQFGTTADDSAFKLPAEPKAG